MSIQAKQVNIELTPGREITVETGKLALQANGSVVVRQGDTMVLVTACSSDPRPGIDFFPLQVEYREKFSAAGMFPGGFFKREGRPSEKEVLTARMTDRPLRPLFPKGFFDEVQVVCWLMSADGENEADVLAIFGASAALTMSDIPWDGPIGALRVGRVNGEFVANPTHSEMQQSDLDLIYAGLEGKTIMIEGQCDELSEEELRDAFLFADKCVQNQIKALNDFRATAGKEKFTPNLRVVAPEVQTAVEEYCRGRIEDACLVIDKLERQTALGKVFSEMVAEISERFPVADGEEAPDYKMAFEECTEKTVRQLILKDGKRSDARGAKDLRQIDCEVGVLPRPHGSALFNRGETQALVTVTLGSASDTQGYDVITGPGEGEKHFFLHYNFPPFSVGECGRLGGVGRREIGHGALAERSVAAVIPEDCQYTIRCVSEILGSNGSSSMASICGASLALKDAGIPIKDTVAGISVGLVTGDDGERVFLTDILGSEDHYGDMDFKLAGTAAGITGFQLDLKIAGLDIDGMYEAMLQNKEARNKIREIMNATIEQPRETVSPHAPRIEIMRINPDKIGALIGPGGKNIRAICEESGAQVDIDDDGTVHIFASNTESMNIAKERVEGLTAEAEVGKIYRGLVKSVKEFGAFVEILPGQEGLLHISEMADYRVDKVEDICNVGDFVSVKVVEIDPARGRIRLSRKEAMADME